MALANQSLILKARGKLGEAMELLEEQERICREIGDKDSLQASFCNKALIFKAWGGYGDAMELLEEQENICREIGNKYGLQKSFVNQALILMILKNFNKAMELLKKVEDICKELRDPECLAISLINQASLLSEDMGKPSDPISLAEEAYRIAVEHGLKSLAEQIKPILDHIRNAVKTLVKNGR